jgi:HPt (histidine-containing phosphotransfer) domain-containing protein
MAHGHHGHAGSAGHAEAEVLDRSAFAQLRETVGDDEVFLADLIHAYRQDSRQLLAAMSAALAARDAVALRRAAHSLKSNSASFGATALAALCRDLEGEAQVGAHDLAAGRVAQVAAEYERVERALAQAQPEGGPAQ